MAKKGEPSPFRKDCHGLKFGKLTIIGEAPYWIKGSRRVRRVRCLCDCGNECEIRLQQLKPGVTSSCGCYKSDRMKGKKSPAKITHGMAKTKTYRAWWAMICRCKGTTGGSSCRKRYFDRGVVVCERWQSFENFLGDMGERPSELHSLDRIDNDGNYEPNNCRWATRKEQSRNTSQNVVFVFEGERLCLADIAERIGMDPRTLHSRIRVRGMSLEDATRKPVRKTYRSRQQLDG